MSPLRAASVRKAPWEAARIHPTPPAPGALLVPTEDQVRLLRPFAPEEAAP